MSMQTNKLTIIGQIGIIMFWGIKGYHSLQIGLWCLELTKFKKYKGSKSIPFLCRKCWFFGQVNVFSLLHRGEGWFHSFRQKKMPRKHCVSVLKNPIIMLFLLQVPLFKFWKQVIIATMWKRFLYTPKKDPYLAVSSQGIRVADETNRLAPRIAASRL
jgi:hypothetical protein